MILVDLGDNIGGGSAGDGTVLLAELARQKASNAVVVIYDPEAVRAAVTAGPGGRFEQPVGGRTDGLHGEPVPVCGVVRSIHDGTWVEDQPRHGGRRFNDQGATAVIELAGPILLVLNSLRTPPFSLGQLTSLGIEPRIRESSSLRRPWPTRRPMRRSPDESSRWILPDSPALIRVGFPIGGRCGRKTSCKGRVAWETASLADNVILSVKNRGWRRMLMVAG